MERLIQKHFKSDDHEIDDYEIRDRRHYYRAEKRAIGSQGKSITENTSRGETYGKAAQPVAQAEPD
jgi:hypothetical protein